MKKHHKSHDILQMGIEKKERKKINININGLDIALLIIRVVAGVEFILHGIFKLRLGANEWIDIGSAAFSYGIRSGAMTLGFLAMLVEIACGLFLLFGMLTRCVSFVLLIMLGIAVGQHITNSGSWVMYSHALEGTIIFLVLMFFGAGEYTIGNWLLSRR